MKKRLGAQKNMVQIERSTGVLLRGNNDLRHTKVWWKRRKEFMRRHRQIRTQKKANFEKGKNEEKLGLRRKREVA